MQIFFRGPIAINYLQQHFQPHTEALMSPLRRETSKISNIKELNAKKLQVLSLSIFSNNQCRNAQSRGRGAHIWSIYSGGIARAKILYN